MSIHVCGPRYPPALVETKLVRIRTFSHALRRYTSLNHLAQAAENVLQDSKQTEHMLKDIVCIDFGAIYAQSDLACLCGTEFVEHTEQAFKFALERGYTLQQWASWLQATLLQVQMQPSTRFRLCIELPEFAAFLSSPFNRS